MNRRAPAPVPISLQKKLLFSAVMLVVSLGLLEGLARVVVRVVPNARFQAHSRLVDATGFPALNEVLVPDPVLFWSLKPDVSQIVLEGRIAASSGMRFTLSTDELGCRRLPLVAHPRQRIAFLGDSCTFGFGVDDNERFAALLQARFPGVQAVDLGVPGYTAYQGRLRLERFPFPSSPSVVVVTFGFNDQAPWDNVSDLDQAAHLWVERSWIGHSSLLMGIASMLRPNPATAPEPTTAGSQATAPRPRLSDDEFANEIRAIAAWCRDHHAMPVLVVWPFRGQLARDELSSKQQTLLRLAGELRVPCVNLVPVFRTQGGRALFADVVHASRAGHVAVADALEPVLRDVLEGRVPPPVPPGGLQ